MPLIPNFVEGCVLLNFKKVPRVIQDFHGAEAFRAASPNDRLEILERLSFDGGQDRAADQCHRGTLGPPEGSGQRRQP
jgi:hypothetical protein